MECNEFGSIKDLALLRCQKKLAIYKLFLYLSARIYQQKSQIEDDKAKEYQKPRNYRARRPW